jgi:hypothetical protein
MFFSRDLSCSLWLTTGAALRIGAGLRLLSQSSSISMTPPAVPLGSGSGARLVEVEVASTSAVGMDDGFALDDDGALVA